MAWVEDTGKRSANAKHFYDASTGKWRADFTIHHQHFHDGAAWQDVDESIVDDGVGGFAKKCDKTRHQFRVASAGAYRWYPRRNVSTEYVDITAIQYWRTTGGGSWRALNLPAAVWKSQGAEWDMTDVYASITNTWHRIKSEFILKTSAAPTRLRFAISFTGLTYSHSTGDLTSTTDGLVWGRIDKPTAKDANGADVPVTATYDGTYIEWSANVTGATYPITVDPTFTDGYGGDATTYFDCYTYIAGADADKSIDTHIEIRGTGAGTSNGLIKFTLSALAGVTTTSRTLSLFSSTQDWSNLTVNVYRILVANSGWTEVACWNHADGSALHLVHWAGDAATDGGTDAGCSVSGTDYSSTSMGSWSHTSGAAVGTQYDVALGQTEFEAMVSANYGLALIGGSDALNRYASSDHATTGYRPKLVVEYTAGGLSIPVAMHHYQFNLDR